MKIYNFVIYNKLEQLIMKPEMKKLKGSSVKTQIGQLTLKQFYRQNNKDYDVIYFKATGVDSICKIYDLQYEASSQRFHNQMQQYSKRSISMIYDRVHCQEIKIKKISYGLVCFQKLDKQSNLQECMNQLSSYQKVKLSISLIQMLQQLKQQNKIYCNIRPNNIYRISNKFVIINAEFLRLSGIRNQMDSYLLQSIDNNWEYWAPSLIDTYSNQPFDYSLDVYSVGCVLFQCIIGKYPFQSKLNAANGLFDKFDKKSQIFKLAELFISKTTNRRTIDFKEILSKLNQNINVDDESFQLSQNINFPKSNENSNETQFQKNSKKQNNGILGNISNVFSKMMNDSEGWFLNYVQDDQKSPNQKYLDNILIKMYKKQQKADKLSGIIHKFVIHNSNKVYSIKKSLLLIAQSMRKGPQAALSSFLSNITEIKNMYSYIQGVQPFSSLLLKKVQTNQKFKKLLNGNFYLGQITNFKLFSISDLHILSKYLQSLIQYVRNKPQLDNSQLSLSIINFACDEIYDLVSMMILSIISIRKDNEYQLRKDNIKQLQPVEKNMNTFLKKISNLSNFISAHAIYSLQYEYIPYQQQIMLKNTPYYSTLQYFYHQCRTYKGLAVPTDYSQVFGSTKDEKKLAYSANKQTKNITAHSEAKNYFKEQINSDDEQDFNKMNKLNSLQHSNKKSTNNSIQQNNSKAIDKTLKLKKQSEVSQNLNFTSFNQIIKNSNMQPISNRKSSTNSKNQTVISFEQFGNMQKIKQQVKTKQQIVIKKTQQKSPKKFDDFLFFNQPKTQLQKKPPLPVKKQSNGQKIQQKPKKNFAQFDEIFQKKPNKKMETSNNLQVKQTKINKSSQNFYILDPFFNKIQQKHAEELSNPLLKRILQGLKLKQLKDLLMKNKKFLIQFSSLKLIKIIGSGSAGQVSYGKFNDQDVAIKKVKAKQNPNALKQFQRQMVTYIKIQSNPYLVSFVGVSEFSGDFYLVTQYCTSGSLFDLLHKKKLQIMLSWKERLNFAIQIAQGMHYLHSMKPIIIHRDLKSLNVFVTKIDNNWRIKVADFGLSRSPDADMMTTQLGTIHWMAPQLLEGNQYSFKVDVYSYGILLWQILSRNTPYSNLHNPMAILKHVVIDKMRPPLQAISPDCPPQLIKVMQKCWSHEPADRPTFLQVLNQLKIINL